MGYCENHLRREKGSRAGEVGMILIGVVLILLGALILSAMVYAIFTIHEIVFSGILIGIIFAVSGVALIVYAARRRNNRRTLDADVEGSGLVKAIRRQLPPEQANLSVRELFDLVDRDLEGGQCLGQVDVGRSWALIDKTALRLENIRGIFLY